MAKTTKAPAAQSGADVRNKILETASDLFYKQGVRAVASTW